MATTLKQLKYGTLTTLETTSLNSLVANATVIGSAASVSGDATDADLYADFELVVTFAVAPTVDTEVRLCLIRSVDGTNYEDASATVRAPGGASVGGFQVTAVATAQRLVVRDVQLPPGLWKPLLINTNQAWAASGNTLKVRVHNLQNV
jgi:hypothetical protein